MAKFYDIDPNTCSIEELKDAIANCNGKMEYYGALEQGCKKFINSVYGALGSAYYTCANTAIAESVTLQGQDLIKFSSKKVNYLVGTLWTKLNELIHPTMYLVRKTNNVDKCMFEICGSVPYNEDEEVLDAMRDMLSKPNELYIFISEKTIGIGYRALIKQLCRTNENKITFLNIPDSECIIPKEEIKQFDARVWDEIISDSGVCFKANVESFNFIFEHLNIYRRIGYDMKKIDENFDIDSLVLNCKTPIVFPKSTQKVDDNGLIINTLQCYGDTDSSYITLQPLIESCKISPELATHFILSFNEHVMEDYLNLQFDSYAKKFNCTKNLENFELEKVARSVLMQRKKKYVMDIAWTDSNIFYDPLKKLVFKGVEAVKGESSLFVRKEQKDFVKWIIDNVNQGKDLKYPEIVAHIKAIKDRFLMATPDDICVTKSLSDYDKYILNDKGTEVIFAEDVVVPFHAKASSWYNNLLYTRERRYRSKYDMIRKGDKVRIYYVKEPIDDNHKTFAYLPGNFPVEFAPAIDMNEMFTKLILDPLNRYVEALGYNPIGSKLTYKTSLF